MKLLILNGILFTLRSRLLEGLLPQRSGLCCALFGLRCHGCGKNEGNLATMRDSVLETRWHKSEKGA